ncbi:hypothetical protein JXA63_04325, partial [Candidatus Woesebacteria bacterium]|nr:hypothetical protein [Candidatus Woesebacteria bacterium]
RQLLLGANIGEGIFFAGSNHVPINIVASPEEHELITTNPEEILKRTKTQQEMAQNMPMKEINTSPREPISPTRPAEETPAFSEQVFQSDKEQ